MDLRERFDQLAQVSRPASGQQALLNVLTIGKQADAIAGVQCKLSERYGSGAGVVEFGVDVGVLFADREHRFACGDKSNAGPHQATAIEHDPHGLAAFGLVLPSHQAAAARSGCPADIA